MKRALFILILMVAVVIGLVLIPARPKASWWPRTQITFLCFTNTVANAPATNACFGLKDLPFAPIVFAEVEISRQDGKTWKQYDVMRRTLRISQYPGQTNFELMTLVPVESTNGPCRVVFQLEKADIKSRTPPAGKAGQFFEDLRVRWMRHRYPNNPERWWPRGPLFYITNEFNFGAETNSVVK